MNSAGISLTGNALNPNDTRVGIPKVFPVRKALEARRIGEALVYAMPGDRASSYNNICSDGNGEIYSLEGSATDFGLIYAVDGYLVHTNHYTVEKMQRFEANPSAVACSIVRYSRASKLAKAMVGRATVETIAEAFRDHVNRPDSICRHVDQKLHRLDASETIFSVIFDLTNLEAHVLKGHPCEERWLRQLQVRGLSQSECSHGKYLITPAVLRTAKWAHSLAWLEHPADNREVTGPNPVGPTPFHPRCLPSSVAHRELRPDSVAAWLLCPMSTFT